MFPLPIISTTWRRPFACRWLALACLLIFSLATAHAEAVRGLYVGSPGGAPEASANTFYPLSDNTIKIAKQSGFNRLFLFTLNVESSGDITYNGTLLVRDGAYKGDTGWLAQLKKLKDDGRITRLEACIGSAGSDAFANIRNLVNSLGTNGGTGTGSILYRNFLAFKNATGVDAIQYDDEKTYDRDSAVKFGRMLNGNDLKLKVTFAPYERQDFWKGVRDDLGSGIVDAIYLQCYDGGAGNDPAQWNGYFGNGVKVFPGLYGNTSSMAVVLTRMRDWQKNLGMNGGFMWLNGYLEWDSMDYGYALRMALDPTPFFMFVNRSTNKSIDLISGNTGDNAPTNQWTYDYNGANQRWAIFPTENNDHFKLLSWVSGRSLSVQNDSTGDSVQIQAYRYTGNNPSQQWDLVDAGNGWFKLKNVRSGKLAEVFASNPADNTKVQQYTDVNGLNQQWRLQPQGDYTIRTTAGKYVCVKGAGSTNGSPIIQYTGENNPWFKWRFESVGDGNYKVSSLNALTRCLCVIGGSSAQGANCHLFDYFSNNAGDQKVRLKPLLNGAFSFSFVHDGLYWNMNGFNNDTPLGQKTSDNSYWQLFGLERQ